MKSYQFSEFVLFALKFALKWFLHNRIPGRLEHHFILMPIKLRKCFFRRLFFRLFFFFFDFRFFFLLLPAIVKSQEQEVLDLVDQPIKHTDFPRRWLGGGWGCRRNTGELGGRVDYSGRPGVRGRRRCR